MLTKIAETKKIVIIVDELDRCVPEYAIKVMERLHHLFENIDNTIVIISIDSDQLKHSIKEIYGEETDVDRYLKKFISFKKTLSTGELTAEIFEIYDSYLSKFNDPDPNDIEYINRVFPEIWRGVDMRTQEKLMDKANILHSLICQDRQSLSLFMFEVFVVRYQNIRNGKNLSWIPRGHFSGLSSTENTYPLLKEHEVFLNELVKSIGGGSRTNCIVGTESKTLTTISNNIRDMMFLLLAKTYIDEDFYYCNFKQAIQSLISIAKRFQILADSID